MQDKYRNTLIITPAIKLVLFVALVLGLLIWVPSFLENTLSGLSIFKKTGQEANIPAFPIFVYLLVPLVISLPLIIKLITGIATYSKWNAGNLPSCPFCQGPMVQRTAKKVSFEARSFGVVIPFLLVLGRSILGGDMNGKA